MAGLEMGPRSELKELQYEAGRITDQSLESTRRMLTMMEESEEVGKNTIESLALQGEQLNRIDEGFDHINEKMKNAKKTLKSLKRCCYVCATPCKTNPVLNDNPSDFNNVNSTKGKIISHQPRRSSDEQGKNIGVDPILVPHSGYITRITNDAREEEMDSNMGQVNSILDNLRNMAQDMGTELEKQNNQIDNLNAKSDDNNLRLVDANKAANSLLKS